MSIKRKYDHRIIGFYRMTFLKVMNQYFPDAEPELLERVYSVMESTGITFWGFVKPLILKEFNKTHDITDNFDREDYKAIISQITEVLNYIKETYKKKYGDKE